YRDPPRTAGVHRILADRGGCGGEPARILVEAGPAPARRAGRVDGSVVVAEPSRLPAVLQPAGGQRAGADPGRFRSRLGPGHQTPRRAPARTRRHRSDVPAVHRGRPREAAWISQGESGSGSARSSYHWVRGGGRDLLEGGPL